MEYSMGLERPTRAEIYLDNLRNNYSIVRGLVSRDVKIMGVVKANAYGHGILRISSELLSAGADYLGTAYIEEAVYLRRSGITAPILVLGAINPDQIDDYILNDIELATSSIIKSEQISERAVALGKKAIVHIKIDTGMERIGVHWYNAMEFIKKTYSLPNIHVKGIFSHFAKSDTDSEFTKIQLDRFNEILTELEKERQKPELCHIANSSAVIEYKESHLNMVRPGIMLYGYAHKTEFGDKKLLPVMALKSKVAYFKVVKGGHGIGYGHTYKPKEDTRVVTVPIGYGDGYSRGLSNRASVIIRGMKYPVAGTICMDQLCIDITPDGTAYNGDDVLLFGRCGNDEISLVDLCNELNTIPYELLCRISGRVPRIYI